MIDEIRIARRWMDQRPIFLDTETTGLGEEAEACEVAVIDHDGASLLETLVRPTARIPNEAIAVHGITNAMVATAPSFNDLRADLFRILHGRLIVIYNAEFDSRILLQSAIAAGRRMALPELDRACAMQLYADYRGEWSDYHHGNRWFKLEVACAVEHISTAGIRTHRALGDAELTRRLVQHMANQHLLWERDRLGTKPLLTKGATL